MALREEIVEYSDGDVTCKGWMCYDEAYAAPLPAVLISHTWGGRDEFVERKARRIAWHGYACFALDMYGQGRRGRSRDENAALMKPFMEDRALLARRMQAALTALRAQAVVDTQRIAAIGFCFGGLCALDLARSGADVRGVVSFHGLLKPLPQPSSKKILAKVLVLHGNDDPMAPSEEVLALQKELSQAQADWQLHLYGNTMHAFTNPDANDRTLGTVYKEEADRRSWHTLMNFLEEVLR
jgi:dienelactone hydrolase